MNLITIHGRITRDPEIRNANGASVCNLSVAVDRPMSKEKETDFFNVTAWRQQADVIGKYCKKGSEIIVSGSMQSRSYMNKEGTKVTAWDLVADRVEFCGGRSDGGAKSGNQTSAKTTTSAHSQANDEEEDLPFN